jgi:DNA-binding NarL/FixJ family response regulator
MNNEESYTYLDHMEIEKPTVVMIDKRSAISGALIDMFKKNMDDWKFLAFSNVLEAIDQTTNTGKKLFLLNVGGIELSKRSLEECVNTLRQQFLDVPIIIFADNEELLNLKLFSYLKLNGFMTTSIDHQLLAAVIKMVIVGGIYIPEKLVLNISYDEEKLPMTFVDSKDEEGVKLKSFTPRQRDVGELLHYGLSNKVIADRLNICESTVKVHMTGIMKKLGVTNRTQAAYFISKFFGSAPPFSPTL